MNSVQLLGRLARDPEVRYTAGDNPTAVARFTVACARKYKKDAEQTADFISCMAFGKTAEFIERYFKGWSIEAIGDNVGYTYRWAWEKIHEAEEEFISIYEKTT